MKFILGEKVEMTQLFKEDGSVLPVTVISAPDAFISQVKTVEKDGYSAIQIASHEVKESRLNKAQRGHLKGIGNLKYSSEIRLSPKAETEYKKGDKIELGIFEPGDIVHISGVSKGKGFQGGVKRHGFAGGPKTHGHRHDQRRPGSIGTAQIARVFKGTRMAGRMGGDRITVKNLQIVSVDTENRLLFVKGAVPGSRGTMLEIISK